MALKFFAGLGFTESIDAVTQGQKTSINVRSFNQTSSAVVGVRSSFGTSKINEGKLGDIYLSACTVSFVLVFDCYLEDSV